MSKLSLVNKSTISLAVRLYDFLYGARYDDYHFYRSFLSKEGMPSLEIGSGTGRLLLGYAQEGFLVEGVEPVADFTIIATNKAQECGVVMPLVHQQSMQGLSIDKKYSLIYVPSGIIGFLLDEAVLHETMRRFSEHIVPGGKLIISLVNWSRIDNQRDEWYLQACAENVRAGEFYYAYEKVSYDQVPLYRSLVRRYEVWRGGSLQEAECEHARWRSYSLQEIGSVLENLRFSLQAVVGDYAFSTDKDAADELIIVAQKIL